MKTGSVTYTPAILQRVLFVFRPIDLLTLGLTMVVVVRSLFMELLSLYSFSGCSQCNVDIYLRQVTNN